MRLAIISDIHSNLEALRAVLAVIDQQGADAVYCLGDVVGYGADPAACLDLVSTRVEAVVLGNHDLAVATGEGIELLPPDGQKAARHNHEHLSDEQRSYLAGLPLTLEADGCTFVHASPLDPFAWHRLDTYNLVQAQFDHFATDVCFVGHTHIPAVISNKIGVLRVRPGNRYLINVGSVGQPRDENPRAAFAFFDTETFEHDLVRVPYDVETASAKIRDAGLPRPLARRLRYGR